MYIISSSSENSYRKMNNHRHTIYTNIYIYMYIFKAYWKTKKNNRQTQPLTRHMYILIVVAC